MDKLIEKMRPQMYCFVGSEMLTNTFNEKEQIRNAEICANITKEVACGFAEWIRKEINQDRLRHYDPTENGKWAYWKIGCGGIAAQLTTSELFNIYIKSL